MKSPSTSPKELRQDVITPVAKREPALAKNLLLSGDSFSPTSSGVLLSKQARQCTMSMLSTHKCKESPVGVLQPAATGNKILGGLSQEKYHRLFSNLRPVVLTANQVLYDMEDKFASAYFINNGMASFLSIAGDGSSIEIGNVGNEGMVGIPIILREAKTPYRIIVQVSGDAVMVSAEILRHEFEKEGELKDRLLRYTYALSTYMCQLGVCNHFHTAEKRLSRWLLIASDRVQSNTFQLTHEFLAQVLGTSRTGVTMAAIRLQRSGLICCHRSEITILNRPGLEAVSCDCYPITKQVFEHFLSR
jgi:CRP-like cAMP-binding protein